MYITPIMKIELERVKRLKSVLERFYESGRQDTESFLIDPADNYLYFKTTRISGRIVLPMEMDDGEEIPSFFVDAMKFLHLTKNYTELNVHDDLVFYHGKDTFKIPTFHDDSLAEDVRTNPAFDENCRDNEIIYDEELLTLLQKANLFVDGAHSQVRLRGAFIQNGKLVSVNKALVFEAGVNHISADHSLTKKMISIILGLGEKTTVQRCNKPYRIVNPEYEIEIIMPHDNSLEMPDTDSDKFVENYHHDTKMVLGRKDLSDAITFVNGYTKLASHDGVRLTVDDDVLAIESIEDGLFHKVVPLNTVDDGLDGLSFQVSAKKLDLVLKAIRSDHIQIRADAIHPLIEFTGIEDDSFHVILAKIKE